MKKVADYRKLLGVDKTIEVKELKAVYRNFMKEWHPDKFQDETLKLEAEEKSKALIEAYNFLLAIAPETIAANLEDYTKTVTTAHMLDFRYKSRILEIDFSDGSKYEYFDVPANVYTKLVNSDVPSRFIRRNICGTYTYRMLTRAVAEDTNA